MIIAILLLTIKFIVFLDTDMMENLDAIIEIPMYGVKNSLNIAACAPVVLYEVIRQWNSKK